jgi:hypothetical protein
MTDRLKFTPSRCLPLVRIAAIVTVAGLAAVSWGARAGELIPKKATPPIDIREPAPHCGALPRGDSAFKACIDAQLHLDASNPGPPTSPVYSSR